MSPDELKTLIESDSTALLASSEGRWKDVADRCSVIAPKAVVDISLNELQIIARYDNPADAETVLQAIDAVAQANPLVKRVAAWTKPGAPGVNFGDARVRSMLTLSTQSGGLGLTQQQAAPLLAAAEQVQTFTPLECRIAMTGG